ncbi:MAG TPA: hypothetical protein VF808_06345 [Ktedonobacterales bacterium]
MTYSPRPRTKAPNTVRLEDQQLPEREVAFYTPRAGDWLLLGVLVVALLGIGARVWSQLGWGDPVGRAIFFGLLLMAIYWLALVYTFKLSLSARVGPQGMAIVRGPWRVELRWSEITRLMERPQVSGGRRYRWVVALARDGRRIQVREDALLDYERYRREVYERYRLWRDHGGTWGTTGGGPFIARESVSGYAGWWALAALMVALLGVYLALLIPTGLVAGLALLGLTLLSLFMVLIVFVQRRVYSLDGRMIESKGAIGRVQLTWREVSKVERTRFPAGGVILAAVAAGRLALRLASRGDGGIRSFAWSPRVPEYVTLRGGGRRARIRLHHLAQPEELLAWIEYYTGLRRAGTPRPEAATATGAQTAPRRAPASSGSLRQPATPIASVVEERAPDLSSPTGPIDPWGGGRRGDVVDAPVEGPRERIPEPLFRGAPSGASFQERAGLDQPPETPAATGVDSEAWLRETGALLSMSGAPTAPLDDQAAAPPLTADQPRPAMPEPVTPRSPQFIRRPGFPRRAPAHPPIGQPPAGKPPAGQPQVNPRSTKPTLPDAPVPSPFAPYNPDMPREEPSALPMRQVVEAAPASHPAMVEAERTATAPVSMPLTQPPDDDDVEFEGDEGEDWTDYETPEEPAPWLKEGWQPPVLPRFGPQAQAEQENGPGDR